MAETKERDLVLSPTEFAFVLDRTKGLVSTYVGPHKTSLADTDQPVKWDNNARRFANVDLGTAISTFATAPAGSYLVLENPATNGTHPKLGLSNSACDLDVGKRIVVQGPCTFALWPGQVARVIAGHELRYNQYMILRVIDAATAKARWAEMVCEPTDVSTKKAPAEGDEKAPEQEQWDGISISNGMPVPALTTGRLLMVKGTDVSFFIPPTGIEVVPEGTSFVREAVTLERLEYAILLDESGEKRFVRGPDVVFPKPSEAFVTKNMGSTLAKKFRAIELSDLSGLYVKVIEAYKEGGQEFHEGQELFITGKDKIYFPRPEHAIVRYGEKEIHYAVAVPAGEGRYVLDRETGVIRLARGPMMLLCDPRKEVIVRRILTPKQVSLWFPGNAEAEAYNAMLREMSTESAQEYITDQVYASNKATYSALLSADSSASMARSASAAVKGFGGDSFKRKEGFTQPRSISLDTKYDGAVLIDVWPGYAVQVVKKTGERRVVVGPAAFLLEYDETLEPMELSTGTPKDDSSTMRTVYLRSTYNKVSDLVEVETSDMTSVAVSLAYRVNFEGEPTKWFSVDNYVKFLTEHLRSLLRNVVRHKDVTAFYADAASIIRDSILGTAEPGKERPGRAFAENGMRVYDVEVLGVHISDATVSRLLLDNQRSTVIQDLQTAKMRRDLALLKETTELDAQKAKLEADATEKREAEKRRMLDAQNETDLATVNNRADVQKASDKALAEHQQAAFDAEQARIKADLERQDDLTKISDAQRARAEADSKAKLDAKRAEVTLAIEELKARTDEQIKAMDADAAAVAEKAKAIQPEMVAALTRFGDDALAREMAQSLAPLAILGGESVAEVMAKFVKGTRLETLLLADQPQPPATAAAAIPSPRKPA